MVDLEALAPMEIREGRSIGWITLGASLHAILTRIKAQPRLYPVLDLSYSAFDPVLQPIVLSLLENGLRLRFDGPDQRLRLIEVLDFSKVALVFDKKELVRRNKPTGDDAVEQSPVQGPLFRHVYNRIFGVAYRGEYIPPDRKSASTMGTYVLSYPGVSLSFPIKDKLWSDKVDHAYLVSSNIAGPATSLAVYQGASWPEARPTLFTAVPDLPRSLALSSKNKEAAPDEIDMVRILGAGRLEVIRRSSPPLQIVLNETTPQDLVAELGPPDSIHRKSDNRISIHAGRTGKTNRRPSLSPAVQPNLVESDQSSAHSYTEDSDEGTHHQPDPTDNVESFYSYFHHGFDALVSYPGESSPPFPESNIADATQTSTTGNQLVVTKILLHANIPGSYPFNRHRRSRWTIETGSDHSPLTSEMSFPALSSSLKHIWQDFYADAEEERNMQRGMVLNRGWDESPESSVELLGGFEEEARADGAGKKSLVGGNMVDELSTTELFGFPGLLFEVLKNDAVSCLTVY